MFKNLSAEELKEMIRRVEDYDLIDVRTPGEFAASKIEKARLVPLDKFQNRIQQEVTDKSRKVVLICRSGSRSSMAAMMMVQMGYTDVYNLVGGMLAWSSL